VAIVVQYQKASPTIIIASISRLTGGSQMKRKNRLQADSPLGLAPLPVWPLAFAFFLAI
jgi:hypothetical protein